MRLALACFTIASVATLASAQSRGNWQAVAYSPSTGQDGYALDHPSKAEAEAKALSACAENGVRDCAVAGSDTRCLVLTAGADRVARVIVASTQQEAEEAVSSAAAGGTTTVRMACAEPERSAKR